MAQVARHRSRERSNRTARGRCNDRKYLPHLVDLVADGTVDPEQVRTPVEPLTDVIGAYDAVNARRPGWIRGELQPGM